MCLCVCWRSGRTHIHMYTCCIHTHWEMLDYTWGSTGQRKVRIYCMFWSPKLLIQTLLVLSLLPHPPRCRQAWLYVSAVSRSNWTGPFLTALHAFLILTNGLHPVWSNTTAQCQTSSSCAAAFTSWHFEGMFALQCHITGPALSFYSFNWLMHSCSLY